MKKNITGIFLGTCLFLGSLTLNPENVAAKEMNKGYIAEPTINLSSTSLGAGTNLYASKFFTAKIGASYADIVKDRWRKGTVVSDGNNGNYVTNYFWVSGSNISNYNVVDRARRKAIIAKYGKVESKYKYKLKTTQHIAYSHSQIQGQMTVSAKAWCYSRK